MRSAVQKESVGTSSLSTGALLRPLRGSASGTGLTLSSYRTIVPIHRILPYWVKPLTCVPYPYMSGLLIFWIYQKTALRMSFGSSWLLAIPLRAWNGISTVHCGQSPVVHTSKGASYRLMVAQTTMRYMRHLRTSGITVKSNYAAATTC